MARKSRKLASNDQGADPKPAVANERPPTPPAQPISDEVASTPFELAAKTVWATVGFVAMIWCGVEYGKYMKQMHENQLWFSNIDQLEQEISLRTECGLYYSYYKQLLQAPTIAEGITQLTEDNATEHGRTINILQRFNIYQEVILAGLYETFKPSKLTPMLFYVYAIFAITGVMVSALFALIWHMTGTWVAGLLVSLYMLVGMEDATRVFFTVNLRESFALPALCLQILVVCLWLSRRDPNKRSTPYIDAALRVAGCVTTTAFALSWQFQQFVLIIQAASLYGLVVLRITRNSRVMEIYLWHAIALATTYAAQFAQPMLLGSLHASFLPAAAITLWMFANANTNGEGIVNGALVVGFEIFLTAFMTLGFNFIVKLFLELDADEHIYKFVKGKFGLSVPTDFEARIYLCHGAFKFLDTSFFTRTSATGLFPLYTLATSLVLFHLCRDTILQWCALVNDRLKHKGRVDYEDSTDQPFLCNRRPALTFLTIQATLCGFLAMMTMRMKYIWYPQMCILAVFILCDEDSYSRILRYLKVGWEQLTTRVTHVMLIIAIVLLAYRYKPTHDHLMGELKEFWDPDTVELMQWIHANTPPRAAFAGSMQLLAAVKLCTQRHTTNHPHFEDAWLRRRTKDVYQMYARQEPQFVHEKLMSSGADFIILEDSICLAQSDGCSLPDIMDLDNGHIPDSGYATTELKQVDTPRFCDEVRYMEDDYARYFKLLMENKTFRIYRVMREKM